MINNNENYKSHFYINSISNKKKKNGLYSLKYNQNQNKNKSIKNELLNINDFIKQKNKFEIKAFFDEIESNIFLKEKEEAMKEINLNDEIFNQEENQNYNNYKLINESLLKEKKLPNKNLNIKLQENNITQKIKKAKEKSKRNSINIFDIINKHNNDSNDSNFIYRFIIKNADESEEKFHEKLEKELKIIESKKRLNRETTNIDDAIYKSLTIKKDKKEKNYDNKTDKKNSLFNFSENAKKLMLKEKIEVSSINNDETTTPDKHQMKTYGSFYIFNKKEKEKLKSGGENEINNCKKIIDNIEINSDKESLLSIISDLL